MILISHRGNINGSTNLENSPEYIDKAIGLGYDVEIDLWCVDCGLWLGHDNPQYSIDFGWLIDRRNHLWIHCKNIDAALYIKSNSDFLNYFWHNKDDMTLTSLGYFWTHPGKKLTKFSIAVLPEINKFDDLSICFGICSDYISLY